MKIDNRTADKENSIQRKEEIPKNEINNLCLCMEKLETAINRLESKI